MRIRRVAFVATALLVAPLISIATAAADHKTPAPTSQNSIDPKEVQRIFMEWTVDAYDWVMVPNVMGMSQYADGGKMMTRIYFSSSNYIDKMSTFKKHKNEQWWKIWDAIYYSFINKNIKILENNYATSRQVIHWKNKTSTEKTKLLQLATKSWSK